MTYVPVSYFEDPCIRLVSFDVFDTVITRIVGNPTDVFLLVGKDLYKRGIVTVTPEVFARHRHLCEKHLRSFNINNEISLKNIYKEIISTLGIECRIDVMMNTEIDLEKKVLRPLPFMKETLDIVREKYGRVIFISDMYLPSQFIRERLRSWDLYKDNDGLYVSSEFGVRKKNGALLRIVLENERLLPGQLLHIGDSIKYDVQPARKLGILSYHFTRSALHPSEKAMGENVYQTEGFSSIIAGASRLARLKCEHTNTAEQVVWNTATSVTGPFVYLYALWLVDQVVRFRINTLYFLSRDGYLPYLAVCKILQNRTDINIDVRYIYNSRFINHALDVIRIGPKEWNILTGFSFFKYATLRDIGSALFFEDNSFVKRYLKELNFTIGDWERKLTKNELDRIKNHALENSAFNSSIMENIRKFQALVSEYFDSEGFDAGNNIAIVDSGWTTKSHAPLYKFLKKKGCKRLRFFYVGLNTIEPEIPIDALDAFIFDRVRSRGIYQNNIYYSRPVEILLRSNHGSALSFVSENGTIKPILGVSANSDWSSRYFPLYKNGINSFLDEIISNTDNFSIKNNMHFLAEKTISRFWIEPSCEEAEFWSRVYWEWDPLGKIKYPLARSYRLTDLPLVVKQNRHPELYTQFWRAGSRCITPAWILQFFDWIIIIQTRVKRYIRLLFPFFMKRGQS
jgi:predicted HAD superfamily hydrolase